MKRGPLEGAWKVTSRKIDGEDRKPTGGGEMVKIVSGGRFVWTVTEKGRVLAMAGGSYSIEGDRYTEKVTYADENQQEMVGHEFKFKWEIKDGRWHHVGTLEIQNSKVEIDETWERCQ